MSPESGLYFLFTFACTQISLILGFLDLQVQLEGTENRITKARTDYNETVKSYNKKVKVFPGKFWASFSLGRGLP